MMGGGLFNTALTGSGWVAIISDGPPVLLNTGDAPTFADPQAAITWATSVQTSGQGRREHEEPDRPGLGRVAPDGLPGAGWVLVQPSEGRIVPTARAAAAAPAACSAASAAKRWWGGAAAASPHYFSS